jgi:hypothetical protein
MLVSLRAESAQSEPRVVRMTENGVPSKSSFVGETQGALIRNITVAFQKYPATLLWDYIA